MMIQKRHKQMLEMRKGKATYAKISKRFGVTSERVRQIITKEKSYCMRHNKTFSSVCSLCLIETKYINNLLKLSLKLLTVEGLRLSKLGKTSEEVLMKRLFVKVMRDKHKYSFASIGRMLKKHHTTIIHLYN